MRFHSVDLELASQNFVIFLDFFFSILLLSE